MISLIFEQWHVHNNWHIVIVALWTLSLPLSLYYNDSLQDKSCSRCWPLLRQVSDDDPCCRQTELRILIVSWINNQSGAVACSDCWSAAVYWSLRHTQSERSLFQHFLFLDQRWGVSSLAMLLFIHSMEFVLGMWPVYNHSLLEGSRHQSDQQRWSKTQKYCLIKFMNFRRSLAGGHDINCTDAVHSHHSNFMKGGGISSPTLRL